MSYLIKLRFKGNYCEWVIIAHLYEWSFEITSLLRRMKESDLTVRVFGNIYHKRTGVYVTSGIKKKQFLKESWAGGFLGKYSPRFISTI